MADSSIKAQLLRSDIVSQGESWGLARVEVGRDPMLGALVVAGPRRQTRFVGRGGLLGGPHGGVRLLGPGHALELRANERFLYVPLAAAEPLVEWVLSIDPEGAPEGAPEVSRRAPAAEPIAMRMTPARHGGLYPEWAVPWLGLPTDVATWASGLDVRGTSLSQRTQRLVGESPKRILSAARATIAFELSAHYRGEGAALAIDAGYASQSHLCRDLRDRFGISLTQLFSENVVRELEWLRLLKSIVR